MSGFLILSGLPEDLKTVQEKVREYAEGLKRRGYVTCYTCGRFAGLDYKLNDRERVKITLRKIQGKYLCQICVAEAMTKQRLDNK